MKINRCTSNAAYRHFSLLIVLTLVFALQLKAQAPDLKTAGYFTLFTTTGAIGNTGASSIEGSIGTNTGAVTGFPPGYVSGTIHNTDSLTALAATDIDNAYTFMNGITCDSIIDSTMGNNEVLYPGVYCITSAASLNGNLTLDAQGDASALFIFKIDGALSTGKFANVLLWDSASSSNVYWQINGQFELGDSSVFTGNIVGNGAIILLEGSELDGRGLTKAGAISLFTATADSTGILNPLFAQLLTFTAEKTKAGARISWLSANDYMHSNYALEHSHNGLVWHTLGIVNTDSSSYEDISAYSVLVETPFTPNSFYRLIATDYNCFSTISYSISLYTGSIARAGMQIFPNPGNGLFYLQYENTDHQPSALSVFDALGMLVHYTESSEDMLDLSMLKNGVYTVMLQNDQRSYFSKIILQH